MMRLFIIVASTALCCLFLNATAVGQENFPYDASFGTCANPNNKNDLWWDTATSETSQNKDWSFECKSGDTIMYPCYTENIAVNASLFSPSFHFKANNSYIIKLEYQISATVGSAGYSLRLNKEFENGNTAFINNDTTYTIRNGDTVSILLDRTTSNFTSTYTKTIEISPNSTIKSNGIYAFSFQLTGDDFGGTGNKFYITSFKLTEIDNSVTAIEIIDILSPYSSPTNTDNKVQFSIKNTGSTTIKNIFAKYNVNGVFGSENINISPALAPLGYSIVEFSSTTNLDFSDENTISVNVDSANNVLIEENNETIIISTYEPDILPVSYNFNNIYENRKWHSKAIDKAEPNNIITQSWQFNTLDKSVYTTKTQGESTLYSPIFESQVGKFCKLSFRCKAISKNSLALRINIVNQNYLEADVNAFNETIWIQPEIPITQTDYITHEVIFKIDDNNNYCLALASAITETGDTLQLSDIKIELVEENKLEFYYDFDPYSDISPSYQAKDYLFFANLSSANAWRINDEPNQQMAYNSFNYAEASAKKGVTANDYMIFNPIYLEAGNTYTIGYAKKSGNNYTPIDFSLYLDTINPMLYGSGKTPLFTWEESATSLQYTCEEIEVRINKSDYYYFSFLYKTTTPNEINTPEDDYNLYIDNVFLVKNKKEEVQFISTTIPIQANMGSNSVLLSAIYKNYRNEHIEKEHIQFCLSINDAVFTFNPKNNILPYALGTHEFETQADFSKSDTNIVKMWIELSNYIGKIDTIKDTIYSYIPHKAPFIETFSDNANENWSTNASGGVTSAWQIIKDKNLAMEGEDLATCKASAISNSNYLILNPIQLNSDTTYLIRFYAAYTSAQAIAGESLELLYSYGDNQITDFKNSIETINTFSYNGKYKCYDIYFKPPHNNPFFLAFKADLPTSTYSGDLLLDNILIVDSITANITNIRLSDLETPVNRSFCLNRNIESIRLTITNESFSPVDSLLLYLSINNEVETFNYKNEIAPNESIEYTFEKDLDLVVGHSDIKVFTNLDKSDDTLSASFIIYDKENLPINISEKNDFGKIDISNNNRWRTVVDNEEMAYKGKDYLLYNVSSGKDSSFSISCFNAEVNEYLCSFYLKSDRSSGKVNIYLRDYNGSTEKIFTHNILDSEYKEITFPFSTNVASEYSLTIECEGIDGSQNVYLDDLELKLYGTKDIAITRFLNPQGLNNGGTIDYTQAIDIEVEIENKEILAVENIPIYLSMSNDYVDNKIIEIINSNAKVTTTFRNINVPTNTDGTYTGIIFTNYDKDQNRKNDTIRFNIKYELPLVQSLEIKNLNAPDAVYTNSKFDISFALESTGNTKVDNYSVKCYTVEASNKVLLKSENYTEAIGVGESKNLKLSNNSLSENKQYKIRLISFITQENNSSASDSTDFYINVTKQEISNDKLEKNIISVYPNPVKNHLFFDGKVIFEYVEIYNANAILVKRINVNTEKGSIDLSQLRSGTYIIKFISSSVKPVHKIIKL